MPRVGFEPTNPVFERAKIFHALDRAATVIGCNIIKVMELGWVSLARHAERYGEI
jgi:hypothetical protein